MSSFDVNVQILLDIGFVIAVRTVKWFLSGMSNLVSLEQVLAIDADEAFVANVTGY